MGSKRKRGIGRWLWRGSLAGMGCVLGVGIGICLGRVQVAQLLTDRALRQNGLEDCHLQWRRLDPRASEITEIKIATDSFTLEIEHLKIAYDLRAAWENKEIESIEIDGLYLYYDLTGPSKLDYDQLDTTIKEGIPFPLDSISLSNATFDFLTDFGRFAYSASASIEKLEGNTIQGKALLESESESIEVQLDAGERIDFLATIGIPQVANSLSKYQPDWKEKLGLSTSSDITMANLSVETTGSFYGISPESIKVAFQAGPIALATQDLQFQSNPFSGSFDFWDEAIRNLSLETQFENVSFGEYTLTNLPLELTAPNLQNPQLEIGRTTFRSESGESAEFSALVNARLREGFELDSFDFDLSLHSLKTEEVEFFPTQIRVNGSPVVAQLECDTLKFVSHPFIQLDDLKIGASGLDSENPLLEFSTQLHDPRDNGSIDLGSWIADGAFYPFGEDQKAKINLTPTSGDFAVSSPNLAVKGTGSVSLEANRWRESDEIAAAIDFKAENLEASYSDWSLDQGSVSLSLDTSPINLTGALSKAGSPIDLIEFLVPQVQYELAIGGNQIDGPANSQLQWFSGSLISKDPIVDRPFQAALSLNVGVGRFPPEEFQQLNWQSSISGNSRDASLKSNATLLFEGVEVTLKSNQTFNYKDGSLPSKGEYEVTGIELANSDILARHMEGLEGSIVSGKLSLVGTALTANETWDASAKLKLAEGYFGLPSQELTVDGINANIALDSVASLKTPPSQSLSANLINFGALQATNLKTAFSLPTDDRLLVESVSLETFEGNVYLEPFELALDNPNANLLVKFDEISIAPAIAMVDFFQGRVTGRLNGSLPISLENRLPVLGEGFLELDPTHKATFSYDAEGFFTADENGVESKKSLGDKTLERLGLEPNALLEDALSNLDITRLRVDLFNKDMPLTPMKIQLAGIADTGKAKIPLNITTNVNGTVAELLNFLTRLDSLGLVASEQPETDRAISF